MVGGEGDDQLWGSGHGAIAVWGSGRGAIAGCHCSVPLSFATVWGEGDDQRWGSGRWTLLGAIAGRHCSVLWLAEAFFLYIDNTKIGFCYLGSMLV